MPLGMILEMAASAYGPREALTDANGERTSFEQWHRRAGQGAAWLIEREASNVAYLGLNGSLLPTVMFSCAMAGIPFTPLNFRLSDEQLHEQVEALGNPLLISDPRYLEKFESRSHTISSDTWLREIAGLEPLFNKQVDDDETAVVLFTSGTTSRPKGVRLRHANLVNYVLQTVEFGSADENDATLTTVPPYHVAAIGAVISNLYAGRRVVYLPDFDAAEWLRVAREESVTNAMVVPTMLSRIVDELEGQQAELPKLTGLAYGGAKVSQRVLKKALQRFPTADFVNAYGLTETSSTIALLGPQDHRDAVQSSEPDALARLESVGRPVPGIEVEIRDSDDNLLPPGAQGLIWVRGPQVSGEYTEQGSVLDENGWFPTKDGGYLDQAGYLFVQGRLDDTIIRGGENIAPHEIESVLLDHSGVREAAVVGMSDDEWGQRIVAVVVLVEPARITAEDLTEFVRTRLRSSKTPDQFILATELPYSATGKLLRNQLVTDLTTTP
ncbi:class I adenylate-forming enzyme family protein [Nocardia sp. 348MFTsu5.1]|uniref:class I adenylate-forming enzyme family protein n=1 Tax=Nocardia sp. 348MFTsu5.1 TaxID=1172185 RepID=UPI00048AFE01|nr:AMP-binding protein [Nocardia sp. 348MFTsu5.1]